MSDAVELDRALVSTIWQIARSVVVLPAPLAPRITTTSPRVDLEVDAVQHLDRAVAGARAPSTFERASCPTAVLMLPSPGRPR